MPPRPRPPIVRSVKTPEAIVALREWLDKFDGRTRQRGDDYYRGGQVTEVWSEADHYVEARVEGQEIYELTLFLTRGKWTSRCSCPMMVNCKHVYAAGLAWIEAVESGQIDRDELAPAPPPGPSRVPVPASPPDPLPRPVAPAKAKKSFREQWAPVLAEKLGRPLTDAEGRQLGGLSALYTDFRQHYGVLYRHGLVQHGFAAAIPPGADSYTPLFSEWWDRAHPPADPWALWQYLAYAMEHAGQAIPEVFQPMTDTAAVHAALDERLTQRELAVWRSALAQETAGSDGRLTPVAGITGLRGRFTSDGKLFIETRTAPDKPWKSPSQAWYYALGQTTPADFEHLAAAEAALGLALAIECRQRAYGFAAKRPLPEDSAARILRSRVGRAAVMLPDGRPFAIEPEPLVLEASVSATAQNSLDLRLIAPDGRSAEDAVPVTRRPETIYLFDNRLWRGPPPVPSRQLPVAALGDEQIMSKLRAAGLRLPASLKLEFRTVALQPRLSCWLSGDEDIVPYFQVQLTAHCEEPRGEQVWKGSGGWQWNDGAAPPRSRDDPVWEFDLGAAQVVAARLADFRLTWNEWRHSWTRPMGKNFAEEFFAWHATLPKGVEVELAGDLAGLLDPPLRASIDFSAIPTGPGHDWFDLTLALRVEDTTLTAEEIALLVRARGKWVRLPQRGWRRIEVAVDAADAAAAALDRLGLGALDVLASGKPATHRLHALQLAGEAAAFEARDAKLAAALRERAAKLAALPSPALPAGLTATLRPYQEEGFQFLAHLSAHGFGGVLADDMGLGKTVQTLAWLLHLANEPRKNAGPFRALVVCPKSVTHGWLSETERFAPSLKTELFTPPLAGTKYAAPGPALLVANYTQLRLNAAWFQSGAWDAVVLDEGQFIKNPASQAAAAARALPTRHRLVLTGTPIENRLADLWSLFAFAQPGLLGTQPAFKRQYPEDAADALARLRRRVNHFLLRRTKAQAAPDLPPRTEDDLVVDLEGAQRKLYDAELKRARAQLLGVETDRALDKVRFNVLASLLRLRQICCHPALVDPAHRDLPSAKLEALLERLEELRDEGHQVLVFSQFVEMLEIIRDRLAAAGIGYLMLTGATENRAELVAEFQRNPDNTVFLLSLKAAGFGLNLTAASYVVLYDPWWNPAVEAQAIDRTHRIGQTRPVIAYRLLAENTIEQKIRVLQQEKSALAAAVVQEESVAKVMDLESLRRIFA